MINRRRLLEFGVTASLAWGARSAFAKNIGSDPRFVLVILRGGMDGLAAVPPYADPSYRKSRGALALPPPGSASGINDLDGFFGLHPNFVTLHALFEAGELTVVQAVAPPYRNRSHFDAQDVLETGIPAPSALTDGWLYRALATLPGAVRTDEYAMAIGGAVPRVLRGANPVGAWSPDRLPDPDDDTMARIVALYEHDAILGPRLRTMMKTENMMASQVNRSNQGSRNNSLAGVVKAAAQFLCHESGPRVAVLESGGWDTHAQQGDQQGQLANRFASLDDLVAQFRAELGDTWRQTVLIMVTEFGRTVAMNGTRGSDHGVAGAAFVMGGAVAGGKVFTDWPGLKRAALYEGRDLMPTMDVRVLFKTALVDHLGADAAAVDEFVFPSSALTGLQGLTRV
ncbi:MAG: DUF1501 domain-containing protein [Gammaproteobacteria bacterium]|nr:DUF1501 domain-containing protein [Gammaproteobacteria bacterium]